MTVSTETLIQAVKSLINDIENMQTEPDDSLADQEAWFGGFSVWTEDGEVKIQWPNLAISVANVKEILEGKIVDGEVNQPRKELT